MTFTDGDLEEDRDLKGDPQNTEGDPEEGGTRGGPVEQRGTRRRMGTGGGHGEREDGIEGREEDT